MINFDEIINRNNTNSMKFDRYKDNIDAIPAWVADMDFKSPKFIIDALQKQVNHGVFGYGQIDGEIKDVIISFAKENYNWEFEKSSLVFTSGVVASMNIVCNMLHEKQSVITNTPIYPYFVSIPKSMNKNVATVSMKNINNRWIFDFDEFESKIDSSCKLIFLCNPYNPGGTVFTKDELFSIGEIAIKHDLIICSDEIHADLIIDGNAKHVPIASINEEIAKRTITLMAPSKTFNIAGLQSSFAVISDKKLRLEFEKSMGHINGGINILGLEATKIAYKYGQEWLIELRKYLACNLELVKKFVENNPSLKLLNMQATYLAWIDCANLEVNAYELFLKYGVILNNGTNFGEGGDGFVRLNFGTSKIVLKEILTRMQRAIDSLK